MGEHSEKRDEHKGDEDDRADPEPDPQCGADAEEDPRGVGKRRDNEFEKQNSEGELLEIVPRGIGLGAPIVGLRRSLFNRRMRGS